MEIVASAAEPVTAIATDAVTVPPVLVAVSIKITLAAGVTDVVPELATLPTPLSILIEDAPVTDQDRTLDCPAKMAVGFAVNEPIVGGFVCCACEPRIAPLQAKTAQAKSKTTLNGRGHIGAFGAKRKRDGALKP